jgi:choline dehydrogenase-like flavoprotein
MSASDKHPRGLANGSDQVGRNYMFHNSAAVVAISKRENPTRFQKTLSLNDFYFGAKAFAYPLGNIQMIGKSQGSMFREDAPRFAPGFALDTIAKHAVDFWLTTEDLPDPNNRVTLNANGEIQLHYTFNNQEPTRRLEAALKSMLEHLDCHSHLIPNNVYLGKHIPIAGVGHQAGTCRFGSDPQTSVLDIYCKAHELDNRYVVDTSFFPSIWGGQSLLDGDGQCPARRRPHPGAAAMSEPWRRRMYDALRQHWPEYMMEAAGLGHLCR